jgi:membrane-associated HD superfamily phosphohydrolase
MPQSLISYAEIKTLALTMPKLEGKYSQTDQFIASAYWISTKLLYYAIIITFVFLIFSLVTYLMRIKKPEARKKASQRLLIAVILFFVLIVLFVLIGISPGVLHFPIYLS